MDYNKKYLTNPQKSLTHEKHASNMQKLVNKLAENRNNSSYQNDANKNYDPSS